MLERGNGGGDSSAGPAASPQCPLAGAYDQYGADLFRVARRLLGSAEEAEDAVQDLFVGLVRVRSSLEEILDLRAYLFTSLRRVAHRRLRRRRREARIAPTRVPEPGTCGRDGYWDRERLEAALACLPPAQREVIALKIDGGLSLSQVAAVMGTSPNTAASRYRYALEKLRALLGEDRS